MFGCHMLVFVTGFLLLFLDLDCFGFCFCFRCVVVVIRSTRPQRYWWKCAIIIPCFLVLMFLLRPGLGPQIQFLLAWLFSLHSSFPGGRRGIGGGCGMRDIETDKETKRESWRDSASISKIKEHLFHVARVNYFSFSV